MEGARVILIVDYKEESSLQRGMILQLCRVNAVMAIPSIMFVVPERLRLMLDKCSGIISSQNKRESQEEYAKRSVITLNLSDSLTKPLL